MTVYRLWSLSCTQCGRGYKESDESLQDLMQMAKGEGWTHKKVPNGSYWDFCPKCFQHHKESADDQA